MSDVTQHDLRIRMQLCFRMSAKACSRAASVGLFAAAALCCSDVHPESQDKARQLRIPSRSDVGEPVQRPLPGQMWARRAARRRALLIGGRLASALTANSSAILLLSRNFGSVVTARLDFAAYSKVIEARQSLPRRFISSKSNTSRECTASGVVRRNDSPNAACGCLKYADSIYIFLLTEKTSRDTVRAKAAMFLPV